MSQQAQGPPIESVKAKEREALNISGGDHTVKCSVNLNYSADKKPPLERPTSSKLISAKAPRVKKEDEYRNFHITYNIGPNCEGKSPSLPGDQTRWTNVHDVDITLKLLVDLLGTKICFQIYETIKVEVEKKSRTVGDGEVKKMTLANNGGRNQREYTKSKSKKDLSHGSDSNKAGTSDAAPSEKNLSSSLHDSNSSNGKKNVHAKFAEDNSSSKENNDTAEDATTSVNIANRNREASSKSSKTKRAVSRGVSYMTSDDDSDQEEKSRREQPHPHHYDLPEKHIDGGHNSIRRARSAHSLAALSAEQVRKAPSPHHHDNPITTLTKRVQSSAVSKNGESQKSPPSSQDPVPGSVAGSKDVRFAADATATGNGDGQDDTKSEPHSKKTHTDTASFNGNSIRSRSKSETRALFLNRSDSGKLSKTSSPSSVNRADVNSPSDGGHHRAWTQLQDALIDPDASYARNGVMRKKKEEKKPLVKKVIEIQKVLVGKATVDLTKLFLGQTSADG
jgi:hypothetical protein